MISHTNLKNWAPQELTQIKKIYAAFHFACYIRRPRRDTRCMRSSSSKRLFIYLFQMLRHRRNQLSSQTITYLLMGTLQKANKTACCTIVRECCKGKHGTFFHNFSFFFFFCWTFPYLLSKVPRSLIGIFSRYLLYNFRWVISSSHVNHSIQAYTPIYQKITLIVLKRQVSVILFPATYKRWETASPSSSLG